MAQEPAQIDHFAEQLRSVLFRAAVAGTLAAPVSHSRLLEMIVETAAQVIRSEAASLFVLDEAQRELVFEVALGQKAADVKKFRVPLGHGIAGQVAATGQPTATSGGPDPRQAVEIGESIGYVPRSIICVPLFYADRVIGVLELLDKIDGDAFTMLDMQVLGLFANMAAVALEQSRTRDNMFALLADIVSESTVGMPEPQRAELVESTRSLVSGIAQDDIYQHALRIAGLIEKIARSGDRELWLCERILGDVAEYLDSQPQSVGSLFGA